MLIQMTPEQGERFREILAQLRAASPTTPDYILRTEAFLKVQELHS